jgi:nucleoside-diphosphate-sugar epimerase
MSVPVTPLPVEDLDHVLAHTSKLWAEARGATFFITGGTGFFGMWLLESFARANDTLALGMRAVVLTRDPAAFARKAPHLAARADLEFLPGDMRTFAFPAGNFAYMIHAATDTAIPPAGADPRETRETIVEGTRRVLDCAAQAGVKKLLFTSSGAVYGLQPSDMTHIPEDYAGRPDPLAPGSAYGLGKQISEDLCVEQARRLGYDCKIARCFAFVGPHLPLDAHFAIGNFIRDARGGKPIQVRGDGTPRRSYLYAADLAVWLWTMLFAAPSARAYNVGSATDLSIAELAREVSAAAGEQLPVQIAEKSEPGHPLSRYVPAVNRAESELGLRARISLTEAIRKTIAWHRSGPDATRGAPTGVTKSLFDTMSARKLGGQSTCQSGADTLSFPCSPDRQRGSLPSSPKK